MAGDWPTFSVKELVASGAIERPLDGNHGEIHPKAGDFVSQGVPFIMASDLVNGRVDLVGCSFITAEQAKTLRKGFAKTGDVLLSHKATLGRTAIVGDLPCEFIVLTPQVTYYRVKNPGVINNRFLKYYFDSIEFQAVLRSWAGAGSTRAYIGITDQLRLPVLLPPVDEQKAIAHILGALDDKIELNRRMNETLEGMARAIFKSWFVDFDPVRAKADGRQPAGMDPATAALFPDSFEDSPLGKIPKGWKVSPLPDAIEVNPTRSLRKGDEAVYLDMQAMPTSGHRGDGWITRPFGSGTKFRNGDTLVARITPCLENGKTAFVDFLPDGAIGWGSTEFIVLRPVPPLPPEFAYYLARSEDFRAFAIQNMTGTSGRQRVPPTSLSQYLLVAPGIGLGEAFGRLAASFMSQIRANTEQSATLAGIRDSLLPKLLSGEIRLVDAESAMAGAT